MKSFVRSYFMNLRCVYLQKNKEYVYLCFIDTIITIIIIVVTITKPHFRKHTKYNFKRKWEENFFDINANPNHLLNGTFQIIRKCMQTQKCNLGDTKYYLMPTSSELFKVNVTWSCFAASIFFLHG